MSKTQSPPTFHASIDQAVVHQDVPSGLSSQQWMMLSFSFLLGIASVFTVNRVFLSDSPVGTVHAAVQTIEANP